jgi:hypothetical protein
MLCGLAIQLWKVAFQTIGPLRRLRARALRASPKIIDRVRSFQTSTVAGTLLVAQALVLRLVWGRFGEIIDAINSFILKSGSLVALSAGEPYAHERQWFTRVFALVVLTFGWSWYRLLRSHWHSRKPVGGITLSAGAVLILIAISAMVVPYRLFTQNKAERVSYGSEVCYLVGERGKQGALFCPLQNPRSNKVIDLNNSNIVRTGIRESIFTPLSETELKSPKSP